MCMGFSYVLSCAGASTYQWTPATGLNTTTGSVVTASPLATTTYTIEGIDADGCKATATIKLTVDNLPVISASPGAAICAGNNMQLSAGGASTYNWNPSVTFNNAAGSSVAVNPSLTTSYTVTGTDTKGCIGESVVTVTVNSLPAISVSPNSSICIGNNISLSASGAAIYSWTPLIGLSTSIGSNVNANPTTTTSYTVTGTDLNGCSASNSILLTVNQLPQINSSPNTIMCYGSSALISASGANTYAWSPAATLNSSTGAQVTATPLVPTTYTVIGTDGNGCSNFSTVTVAQNTPLNLVCSPSVTICKGSSVKLSAIPQGGGSVYNYNWQPSNLNTQVISVSPTSAVTYTVTLTDNCGSSPATATVSVFVNAVPVVSFTADDTMGCAPLCVAFTNTTPNTLSAAWNFGDGNTSTNNNPSNCYNTAGSYSISLMVTDNNGCSNNLTKNNYVVVYPSPTAAFVSNPGSTTILNPTISFKDLSVQNITEWQWSFGDGSGSVSNEQNPIFTYEIPGTYSVKLTVTNEFGCKSDAEDVVLIKKDYALYMPNTFTPNGDSKNDIFLPANIGVDRFKFLIFDRWGDVVFQTEDPSIGWDGKVNGGSSIAQQDVYVWKLTVYDINNERHSYIGNVNLIR